MFSIDRRGLQKRGSPLLPSKVKNAILLYLPQQYLFKFTHTHILEFNQSLLVSTIVNKIYFGKIDIL
jgi:hypothetical protein